MALVPVKNPFKPTAGATPPLLVGRDDALEQFAESIDDGPGAPGRLTIFTGPRGVGKTVMLNKVHDVVQERGWVTIAETATPGLNDRIQRAATRQFHELGTERAPRLRGLTLPVIGGGLEFDASPEERPDLREILTGLIDVLEKNETGLLITIDEIHRKNLDELRHLAATVQHLIREDREIAFVTAGLSSAVSDMLNDDVLTFMRRATREQLTDVPLEHVRAALHETITSNGRTITETALNAATAATGGYPFMVQLVGYHCWRKAHGDNINDSSAAEGIPAARKRLGSTVHAAALADLSAIDRTVLLAIASDNGPARTRDVANRIGESPAYISVYRQRLIDAGIIESPARGYLDFTIPYLREYLREHAASELDAPLPLNASTPRRDDNTL